MRDLCVRASTRHIEIPSRRCTFHPTLSDEKVMTLLTQPRLHTTSVSGAYLIAALCIYRTAALQIGRIPTTRLEAMIFHLGLSFGGKYFTGIQISLH